MTVYEQQFMETIIRELPKITKQLENINHNINLLNQAITYSMEDNRK